MIMAANPLRYCLITAGLLLAGEVDLSRAATTIAPQNNGVLVQPLKFIDTIETDIEKAYAIRVVNGAAFPVKMEAFAQDATQAGNAIPRFDDAGTNPLSCGSWIRVGKHPALLEREEEIELPVLLHAPEKVKGRRLCAVMIRLSPKEQSPVQYSRATIVVQYAVLFDLKLDRPALPRIGIREVDWSPSGSPELHLSLVNPSEQATFTGAKAVIISPDNRIVSRLTLTSKKGQEPKEQQELFPGGYLVYSGTIDKPLPPGEYQTRIIVGYGNRRTLVATHPLVITDKHFTGQTHRNARMLVWETLPIAIAMPPKAARTAVAILANPTQEALSGELAIAPLAPRICDGWAIKAMTAIELPAGRKRGIPIVFKEAESAQTECAVHIAVQSADHQAISPPLFARVSIMDFSAGADIQAPVIAKNAVSLSVKNTGSLGLEPTITLFLEQDGKSNDKQDHEPITIALTATERYLWPGQALSFQGEIPGDLQPGVYRITGQLESGPKPAVRLPIPETTFNKP